MKGTRRPPKESAGLLLYRQGKSGPEVLVAHPGGPFWASKDLGAWSLPKGEVMPGEDLLDTARRETQEETGFAPAGPFHPLGAVTQKSGKIVHAWAALHDADPKTIRSNMVKVEWPPRSGHLISIPEIDRAEYFDVATARDKLNPAQVAFLDRLMALLSG